MFKHRYRFNRQARYSLNTLIMGLALLSQIGYCITKPSSDQKATYSLLSSQGAVTEDEINIYPSWRTCLW